MKGGGGENSKFLSKKGGEGEEIYFFSHPVDIHEVLFSAFKSLPIIP